MVYKAKMPEAFARLEWCKQIFGEPKFMGTWWRNRGFVCFRNEQDYMLYQLRWP